MSIPNTNDGLQNDPYLRIDLVHESLVELPAKFDRPIEDHYNFFQKNGYTGIQNGDPNICREMGLRHTHSGRVEQSGDTEKLIFQAKSFGSDCISVHAGIGLETDDEMDRLVEDILNASSNHNFPVYLETHRATITQDMFRTVKMVERFPEIRFNGDFLHWYTGQEMRYDRFSKMEQKFEFIAPVFERVRFIHGRIGNGGCIQVDITRPDMEINISYFKEMWTRCLIGFLRSTNKGDYFIFAPELLGSTAHYVIEYYHEGAKYQEGNRIELALEYKRISESCWMDAHQRLNRN
jgi:hypothetical protein